MRFHHHHHHGGGAAAAGRYVAMREMLMGAARAGLPPSLLLSDRDFTADDYELLCRLDDTVENRKGAAAADVAALPVEVRRCWLACCLALVCTPPRKLFCADVPRQATAAAFPAAGGRAAMSSGHSSVRVRVPGLALAAGLCMPVHARAVSPLAPCFPQCGGRGRHHYVHLHAPPRLRPPTSAPLTASDTPPKPHGLTACCRWCGRSGGSRTARPRRAASAWKTSRWATR